MDGPTAWMAGWVVGWRVGRVSSDLRRRRRGRQSMATRTAGVDVVGRAETKCADRGHWKWCGACWFVDMESSPRENGGLWSVRRSLACPTRPARGGWLPGGRCEPGSFGWTTATEPTGVKAKRNETEPPRKQVSLDASSSLTLRIILSFFWTVEQIFWGRLERKRLNSSSISNYQQNHGQVVPSR